MMNRRLSQKDQAKKLLDDAKNFVSWVKQLCKKGWIDKNKKTDFCQGYYRYFFASSKSP